MAAELDAKGSAIVGDKYGERIERLAIAAWSAWTDRMGQPISPAWLSLSHDERHAWIRAALAVIREANRI
jgi:hypothetical protein